MEQAKTAAGNIHVPGRINRDKCFTLLVIDDANTGMSIILFWIMHFEIFREITQIHEFVCFHGKNLYIW